MPFTARPTTCSGCILHETDQCTGFQPQPDGKGLIPLMIVAEALGENEAKDSLPLRPYAESGSLFERALRSIGIQREQIIVTNLVKCRPQNNRLAGESYEWDAVQHCRQYLDAEVERFKPRAILALGATSWKYLTGFTGKGKQTLEYCRGYAIESVWYPGIPVVGTYHPAHVRRGATELFPVIVHDLHKALGIARGRVKWPTTEQPSYLHSGVAELRELLSLIQHKPNRLLAYDIETSDSVKTNEDSYDSLERMSPIDSVQFSLNPGTGLFVDWTPETIPLIREILLTSQRRSGHNTWLFDDLVLRLSGIPLDYSSRDTLAMWHHLHPDLPANLGFVASFYGMPAPWKHEASTDIVTYGSKDVDAVQRIEQLIESDLRQMIYRDPTTGIQGLSLWDGFSQYVAPMREILAKMEDRGIPRDKAAMNRLEKYIDIEKARLWEEIQANAPIECKPKQVYKVWPEDCRELVSAYTAANLVTPISEKTGKLLKPREPVLKVVDPPTDLIPQITMLGYSFQPAGLIKLKDFLPNSTEHLKQYLRHQRVKIPTNLEESETTGKTELDKLMKRLRVIAEASKLSAVTAPTWRECFVDKPSTANFEKLQVTARAVNRFLESVLTYRKLHKAKATYLTGEGWEPGADGRIHTTFTLSATGTLQLSSRKPNVQNLPKGKNPKDLVGTQLGKLLRETIKAEPGHLIAEFDYSGCHLVTMGLEAEDPDYIRLARLDGHSFLAAHMARVELGAKLPPELADLDQWLSYPDSILAQKLAWVKKNFKGLRNDKAKPALLGVQLGLGSRKLYTLNDESFKNEAEAKRVQQILAKLFPKIGRYQARIRALAQKQGYLISPYGSIRRFSEVEKYSGKTGGLSAGLDAEKAGAFLVQTNAQGKLREAMIDLEREGWNRHVQLINQVHDSLVYHLPITLAAEAIPAISAIMERPAKRLIHPTICPDGLVLKVEAAVGLDWGSIEEVKLVKGKVVDWPENVRGLFSNA